MLGLFSSIQYIHGTTNNHYLSMAHWRQGEVAVSRFLRHVVAGQEHPDPPRRERDEFNRVQGIPDPSYETLICAGEAKMVLHLFLHDYDDEKILSFCAEEPMFVFTNDQDLWRQNKKILVGYVPHGKDLKIIWEKGSRAEGIIKMLKPAREYGLGLDSLVGRETGLTVEALPPPPNSGVHIPGVDDLGVLMLTIGTPHNVVLLPISCDVRAC